MLPDELAVGPDTPRHARELLRRHEHEGAVLVGVVPFDPRQPAQLWVPASQVWSRPDHVVIPPPVPGTSPDLADDPGYLMAVASGLRAIGAGLVDKVVLARTVDVEADRDVDLDAVHARLAARNSGGWSFRVGPVDEPGATLVGASPELVVGVFGQQVTSRGLAGTAKRDRDPVRDAAAGAALADSAKDRGEHAVLAAGLRADLEPLLRDVSVIGPELVGTDRLWHLSTTVTGRRESTVSALEVAYALHPTSAVAGSPRPVAVDLIRVLEPVGRGSYAGLVGWMDSTGDGEWALVLRSGLVTGPRVRLYAGAGVVAGSSPEGEHAETAAKFATLLDALADQGPLRLREPALAVTA